MSQEKIKKHTNVRFFFSLGTFSACRRNRRPKNIMSVALTHHTDYLPPNSSPPIVPPVILLDPPVGSGNMSTCIIYDEGNETCQIRLD